MFDRIHATLEAGGSCTMIGFATTSVFASESFLIPRRYALAFLHWAFLHRALVVLTLLMTMPRLLAQTWPTYRHDNRRSGVTDERLVFPLAMQWRWRSPQPPQTAWSGPAKWDAYSGNSGLQSMRNFDPCFYVTADQQAVQRVDISLCTGDNCIGIRRLTSCDPAVFFHANGHSRLRVGSFGDRVHLIEL